MNLESLVETIRSFFDDFEISVPNLQKPTYVLVRDFYTRALIEFEVDTDNLRKASHLIDGMDSDCEKISEDINLCAAINRAFNFLDFALFDLLSPGDDPRRTVNLMAKVMDFVEAADGLMDCLIDDFDQYKDFRSSLNEMERDCEQLKNNITELNDEKSQINEAWLKMKNEVAKLQMNAHQIKTEYDESNEISQKMFREVAEKRDTVNAALKEKEELSNTVKNLKEELDGLQSLESKEEQKRKAEKEKTELEKEYMLKTALRKKYVVAQEVVKQIVSQNDEICILLEEAKTLEEIVALASKEMAALEQSVVTMKKELDALDNEKVDEEEALPKLIQNMENLKADYSIKIGDLKKKQTDLEDDIRNNQNKILANEEVLQKTFEEMCQMEKEYLSFDSTLNAAIQKKLNLLED